MVLSAHRLTSYLFMVDQHVSYFQMVVNWPICSMVLVYLPTFGWFLGQMLVNIPAPWSIWVVYPPFFLLTQLLTPSAQTKPRWTRRLSCWRCWWAPTEAVEVGTALNFIQMVYIYILSIDRYVFICMHKTYIYTHTHFMYIYIYIVFMCLHRNIYLVTWTELWIDRLSPCKQGHFLLPCFVVKCPSGVC